MNLKFLLKIFFWSCFSSFLLPPDPSHLPIHPTWSSFSQNKNKKTSKQTINTTKINQTKQKIASPTGDKTCVGQLLLAMGLVVECDWYTQWHYWRTDFPPFNSYQLQIASWLGVGFVVCFPFSVLGFRLVWTCVNNCVSVLLYLEDTVSLESSSNFGPYSLYTSSSA